MIKSMKPFVVTVLFIFATLQIGTGIGMIVQYGRLSGFINCQANYNEATSDTRDTRISAQKSEDDKLYDVLVAVRSGKRRATIKVIDEAIASHERYLKIQQKHPYRSPSYYCGPKA